MAKRATPKHITITGASQRVVEDGNGKWEAFYECHKCGDDFSYSHLHDTEKEARDESDTNFDKQQRRFCMRCGYRITDLKPIPEDENLAALNDKIDKLEKHERELWEKVVSLRGKLDKIKEVANG
jgi:DNA-directed RNA polymerase subunit RPC12/RpoP